MYEMYTIELTSDQTLEGAAKLLSIAIDDMDASFGCIPLDPKKSLYAIMVRSGVISVNDSRVNGPFSNPQISPFCGK